MPDPLDACPVCGLCYRDLKTGLSFESVQQTMWLATEDRSLWKYKRRHTVLGAWRQLKIDMWNAHLRDCETQCETSVKETEDLIPF